MAKASGGTRNYKTGTPTYNKRYAEYQSFISNGQYDASRSAFYKGGGFVVTHKDHNSPDNNKADKEKEASTKLAKKGYRVYLESEKSIEFGKPTRDGKIERYKMDIKTIGEAGANSIKNQIERASKQGAEAVILMQGTKKMTKKYVLEQISKFQQKSPKKAREKIKYVIVVGMSGNVHRHKLQ